MADESEDEGECMGVGVDVGGGREDALISLPLLLPRESQ